MTIMTTNTIWVYVTKNDIEKGLREHVHYCPVALAVRRRMHTNNVHAYQSSIYAGNKIYDTPRIARDFMNRFDSAGPSHVEPFRFVLPEGVEFTH